MKKFASIAVLILLLVHILGFYVYFVVRLGQIRQEMRATIALLPKTDMEIFRLTPEEYKQIKVNNHEVKINGKMYDHAPLQVEGDLIILYAVHDQNEDNLLSLVREVFKTASHDNKPVPPTITSYFSLLFLVTPAIELAAKPMKEKVVSSYSINFSAPLLPIEPRPPRS